MFRPKHAAILATGVTALALGGAGVALAAGGSDDSNSSGAATTATTTQSNSSHCDHDNDSTNT